MSEEKILEIALKQSAEDFGCARRDFFADENVVSILDRRSERARKDLKGELFFDVASFGKTIRFPAQLSRRAHNRVFAE